MRAVYNKIHRERILAEAAQRLAVLAKGVGERSWVPPATRLFVERVPASPARERALAAAEKARTQIWNLSPNLHCAIVGTCLSTAEARRLLAKLGTIGVETLSEHEVHAKAVTLARAMDQSGRALQKTLDRIHQATVRRFAAARDEAALAALWEDAVARAEIAAGFWAVLTHPFASAALMQRAFGEVHMLSHLMGAANRADIRRLRQLEAEKAALEDRLARQQAHLHKTFLEQETKLRALNQLLAERTAADPAPDPAALRQVARDLEDRLQTESAARLRAEERARRLDAELARERETRHCADRHLRLLGEELSAAEAQLSGGPEGLGPEAQPTLAGTTLLYVGGRPNQVPHLKQLSERCAATFLYHPGCEDHGGRMPSLVARADAVLFPVDCVSHDAALGLKRLCRQMAKRYIPLRTASLSAFLVALARLEPQPNTEEPT